MTARDAAKQLGRSLAKWLGIVVVIVCAALAREAGVNPMAVVGTVAVLVAVLLLLFAVDAARDAVAQFKYRRAMVAWQRQCDALTKGSI